MSRSIRVATVFACLMVSSVAGAETLVTESAGESLARDKGCMHCHDVKLERIGPSFREIGRRNRNRTNADLPLRDKIKNGSFVHWKSGPWVGEMPPSPARGAPLTDDEARALVSWILTLE